MLLAVKNPESCLKERKKKDKSIMQRKDRLFEMKKQNLFVVLYFDL